MVKKVIDIIPPANKRANQDKSNIKEFVPVPQPEVLAPDFRTYEAGAEVKPRITYVSKNSDSEYNESMEIAPKKNFASGILLKLALATAVVIAGMYAIDLKVARAVVKIWPEITTLIQEVNVIVDPAAVSIDKAKNAIPGMAVSVDDTIKGEVPVTTMKPSEGKAMGVVKIFNNYTTAQRLVKGTRLQAPLEKFDPALAKDETPWFRIAENVVIDPKSTATVKVTADGSGEKYNIDPSVFSVPGLVGTAQYTFVYGQSFEKFSGGTQGDSPQVAQADLDSAKTAIMDTGNQKIKEELAAQVPQGFAIMEDTVKIELGDPVILAKIGDPVAKIQCEIHGKASATAYRKADAESFGRDFINGKIPAGSIADEKNLAVTSLYGGVDQTSGRPSLLINAKVPVYKGMNDTDLKKGLSEKSGKEAEIFLMNQPGTMDVEIRLTPPWRTNIPRELDRIEVQTLLE